MFRYTPDLDGGEEVGDTTQGRGRKVETFVVRHRTSSGNVYVYEDGRVGKGGK